MLKLEIPKGICEQMLEQAKAEAPIEAVTNQSELDKNEAKSRIIDLRGVACPLNFVKAKLELEKLETGSILMVLLDEGEPVQNVPVSFIQQGQDVIEIKKLGEHFSVKVRRNK